MKAHYLIIAALTLLQGFESVATEPTAITEAMRVCETNADCIQIDRSCSGCCNYDAVAKGKKDVFDKAYHASCGDYKGAVCECYDPDYKKPACVEHRCVMVKPQPSTKQ